jgi:hypothetical protein
VGEGEGESLCLSVRHSIVGLFCIYSRSLLHL